MHLTGISFRKKMAYRSVHFRSTALGAVLGVVGGLLVVGDALVPDTATTILRFREQTSYSVERTRSGGLPSDLFLAKELRHSGRLVGRRYRGCDSFGGRGPSGLTLSRRAVVSHGEGHLVSSRGPTCIGKASFLRNSAI